LATNLLEATKAGKISWALTDAEGKFVYAGSRSSVTIEMHTDRFEGDATILSILNDRGTTVDSLQSEATQSEDGWIPAPWNDLLEDLYHAARRVAYNVDEAIDSMLADIERGTPSPPPKPKRIVKDPWASEGKSEYTDEPPF